MLVIGLFCPAIFATITAIFLMIFLEHLAHKLLFVIERGRLYTVALEEIESADSYIGLRNSLHYLSRAESLPDNLGVRDWGVAWDKHFKKNGEMDEVMRKLSQACYSKKSFNDFSMLKKEFLRCLHLRRLNFQKLALYGL